jgi:hypothetical protein
MRTCGWRIGLVVLALGGASGCSDSNELGDTGLPESELLSGLTADDWDTFCKAFDAARRKDPLEECRRQAFSETRMVAMNDGTEADVRATCQARYDACVRDIRPPGKNAGICQFGPIGNDCAATVGEAEVCLKEGVASRKDAAAKVPSCSEVTLEQAMTLAGTTSLGEAEILALPSCQNFESKCPGLLR